jgi:recombination protein RecT
MWLKSAVRQLAKWVPTSAEYKREQLRAAAEVAAETASIATAPLPPQPSALDQYDPADEEPIEGELVD